MSRAGATATESADLLATRLLENLATALGPRIGAALSDDLIVEVMVNPDGKVWIDHVADGRFDTGTVLTIQQASTVVRLVADYCGEVVTTRRPRLQAVLPTGERFQALVPPCVRRPTFTIRKRAKTLWTLENYVEKGIMTEKQQAAIMQAVADHENIALVGGTGTGKTTCANAILALPDFAKDRTVIIEELPELNCAAADLVNMFTVRQEQPVTMTDLVRDTLRMRPDRIVIGECRGPEALDILKAWNTGHPGGLTTFHANSNEEALERVEDMIGEVVTTIPVRTIARALNVLIFVARRQIDGKYVRRIENVSRVIGHSPYRFEHIA